MIQEILYKNKTFGREIVDYVGKPGDDYIWSEDLLKLHIFQTIHKYYGNEEAGHGEFEAVINVYSSYTQGHINKKIEAEEKRIEMFTEIIGKHQENIKYLKGLTPSGDIIETYTITG